MATAPGAMQPYALTLDRFIDHAARWHGSTEVVTGGGDAVRVRTTYAVLRDRSKRLSGALRSLGLERGDRVGVLAWNSQAHLECWYGAMGAGIVCHTLNPDATLSAPKERPYSPVAIAMDNPIRNAGDSCSFMQSFCTGPSARSHASPAARRFRHRGDRSKRNVQLLIRRRWNCATD